MEATPFDALTIDHLEGMIKMDPEAIYTENLARFENRPIQAYDAMLALSRIPDLYEGIQKRTKKLLLRCIMRISGTVKSYKDCDDEAVEETARNALDHFALLENKVVVAACYLRLLTEDNCDWACNPPWRPRIVQLLDKVLGDVVYRELKIAAEQAHEKVVHLAEAVRSQERALAKAAETLTSLEMLSQHRQKLMECLNNKSGQLLFQPFLPQDFSANLGETYKAIERYRSQRGDVGVIDAYDSAIAEIDEFTASLANFDTIYSSMLASKLSGKLRLVIKDDFTKNKAAQPADVKAEARNKKYPLHIVGVPFNLGITVTNVGPGFAHNVDLTVLGDETELQFANPIVRIGRLPPSASQLVEIPAQLLQPRHEVSLIGTIEWQDFDHTKHSYVFDISANAQRSDLDWTGLFRKDPYSLEPVANERELIGRRDILNRLLASIEAANAGSSIIHGQKRVGKTSIAKTLQSQLEGQSCITIYLEAGDYVIPSAPSTIARLGNKLCQKIVNAEPRVKHLQIPDFSQALSPLTDFLDDVNRIVPETKIIVILDEFDELPSELYVRGTWADTFFLTLRSITSRPNIGFVVVGGEKMAHILDYQGDQLNKWAVIQVDYFSRETDWSDYKELVQRPVQEWLEYTEDALAVLHEKTAGNPYFTKLICQYVFRQALSNRDCHITSYEIIKATKKAVRETGKNTFQHFWEDGIVESNEKATEKSIRRRKILIALSDVLQQGVPATGQLIANHPIVRGIASLEADLREFVTRQVLIGNIADRFPDQIFDFKVKFFHDWLKERGVQDVISTFSELDAAMRERQKEEELRIAPDELQSLIAKWGLYRGQVISDDKVRAWLTQFGTSREQRYMFRVLQDLHYYSNAYIRAKMAEVHDIVTRGLKREREYRQQKRADILVSYIDGVGKSGAALARLYAEETQVYVDNVVEKGALAETLKKKADKIQAVVFVDDFVGTGGQASGNIKDLWASLAEIPEVATIKLYFVTIVAFVGGYRKVKELVDELRLPFEVRACEVLDETSQYFGDKSTAFKDNAEREDARRVAMEYGKVLVRDNPLGFGDLGLGVVFEHGCPNDTLPVLWAESGNPKWTPLFPRN
jgi:hypothetical protein